MSDRVYTMTKVGPGDYLLPGNDGRRLYRIARYQEEGRRPWGVWEWDGPVGPGAYLDTSWTDTRWRMVDSEHETRASAVREVVRLSTPTDET